MLLLRSESMLFVVVDVVDIIIIETVLERGERFFHVIR